MKEDSISLSLTFLGVMLLLLLSTFEGFTSYLVIPMMLLLSGIALQFYIKQKIEHDMTTEPKELKQVFIYTTIALFGMAISSFAVLNLFTPPLGVLQVTPISVMLYGALYAISEERFFRGALLSFATWKTGNEALSNISTGGIFSIYHLAVYGSSPNSLIYVLLAGTILGFAVTQSGRLSPAMLGHIMNNLVAFTGAVA